MTNDEIPNDEGPLELGPKRLKDMTLTALADQLGHMAKRRPVLILFEDAHWIDPTTQELLDLIVEQTQEARVLVVITFRPEYRPPWGGLMHVTSLTLNRLARGQCAALVEKLTQDRPLPPTASTIPAPSCPSTMGLLDGHCMSPSTR